MIHSLFTEILSKADWLAWMDFLFSNFDRCGLILLAPIAIFRELRVALLASEVGSHITSYCQRQQAVNLRTLRKSVVDLFTRTPYRYLTAVGLVTTRNDRVVSGEAKV